MRVPAVRGAALPAAAAALASPPSSSATAPASRGCSGSASAAVIVAAIGWAVRPPALAAAGRSVFFVALRGLRPLAGGVDRLVDRAEPVVGLREPQPRLLRVRGRRRAARRDRASPRLADAAAALLGALFVWALAAKVIPGLYSDYGRLARLRYPLGYWNELALLAAASVPIALWLLARAPAYRRCAAAVPRARRRGAHVLARRASCWRCSRALAWLAFDERRYESIGVLAVAWIVGAVVAGIALLLPGVSDDRQSHGVRVQDGLLFGAALLVGGVVVVLALRLRRDARRRPLASCVRLRRFSARSPSPPSLASVVRAGGPGDWVSDRWHEFSNPVSAQVANTPGRFTSTSSSNRWRWWQEAWNAFADHPARRNRRRHVRADRPASSATARSRCSSRTRRRCSSSASSG